VNSPIRTSAIGLLQHLQLLYLPSELDIDEQIQQVTLYFYCMQYQYHPVIPTITEHLNSQGLTIMGVIAIKDVLRLLALSPISCKSFGGKNRKVISLVGQGAHASILIGTVG
jgi:hypothetical protein